MPNIFHPLIEIRTAQDAHRVIEAALQGILPLIRRRLPEEDRHLLASGQVYVWVELPTGSSVGDDTSQTINGIERWTDGVGWYVRRLLTPTAHIFRAYQTVLLVNDSDASSLLISMNPSMHSTGPNLARLRHSCFMRRRRRLRPRKGEQ